MKEIRNSIKKAGQKEKHRNQNCIKEREWKTDKLKSYKKKETCERLGMKEWKKLRKKI